jgi:hypothetical protein
VGGRRAGVERQPAGKEDSERGTAPRRPEASGVEEAKGRLEEDE